MARAQKAELQVESMKMNRVRPGTNAGFNLLFTLLAAMAIIPATTTAFPSREATIG